MDEQRRPRVTLEQLHSFLAVAQREHVTRAAEAIHLSQGAVSQQVMALERLLEVQLMERLGRRVRLTEAGRAVQEAAGAVLSAARAVEATAAAYRGLESGSLRIAASNTTGVYRLPVWIADFAEQHPQIWISMALDNTAGAVSRLRRDEADCAFVEGPLDEQGLELLVIEQDSLALVCAAGHPLARLKHISKDDLARHRYLSRERGSGTEALAARMLGTAYRAGMVLEFGQADAILAGVRAGLGYAALSRAIVEADLMSGAVVTLQERKWSVAREFRAVRRSGVALPVLDRFWTHLAVIAARSR